MFANFVIQNLKHWPVEIGINEIAHLQAQRFVAVDCDACGKKLIRVLCAFREEIDDLPSFNINNRYPLACRCGNTFSATGVYCVFTQCSHSFQCVQYGNTGYSLFALREEV